MDSRGTPPIQLILRVVAFVLFMLAGFGGGWSAPADWPWRGRMVSWGLAAWCLSTFF
jgi:hypothetical protein